MSDAPVPTSPARAGRVPRWVRRVVRIGLVVVCLVLLVRLSMPVLLPVVIGRTARAFGVTCEYDRLKLSVLGTNATLWGLKVRSRDGAQELFRADYANANLSTLQLFRLRLLVWRLEADDVEVALHREADGSIPLLTHLAMGAAQAAPPAARAPGTPRPADFDPPLELKALRLHGVTVRVKDESVSPPFEETVRLDLRVSDIGRAGAPAQVQFVMGSDGLFSAARLEGEVVAAGPALDAGFRFALRGVHADRVGTYLAAAGWTADDRNIDIAGKGSVTLRASTTSPGALEGAASLSDITVRAASDAVAGLAKVDAVIAGLTPSEVHLSELRIENGSILAERTDDGRFRLAAFSPGRAAARAQGSSAVAIAPVVRAAATDAGSPVRWRVDRVVAHSLKASLIDRAVAPVNTLALEVAEFSATDLSNHGSPDTTARFDARLTAPGLIGDIRVSGQASPFHSEPSAAATIDVVGIRPDALTPYLRALGLESTLDGGTVRIAVSGAMDPPETSPRRAGLVLERVVVQDQGGAVVEVGPVAVKGIAVGPGGLEIASVEGSGPVFGVRRLRDGRIEVPGLRVGSSPSAAGGPAQRAEGPPGAGAGPLVFPSVRVGRFAWGAATVHFEDLQIGDPPLELSDAGIEVQNLVLGPAPAEPGSLRLWARAPGLLDRFEVAGTLNSGGNAIAIDTTVVGEGVSLVRLAPYLEPLSIRPTLDGGRLEARLSARLAGTERGMQATFSAAEVALRQDDSTWFRMARADVDRVDIEPGRVAVGMVQLRGCEVTGSRDATGAISAAGVTILPGSGAADEGALPDPLAILAALGDLSVEGAQVEGLTLRWSDDALKEPMSVAAVLDASVGALALNRPDAPAAPMDVRVVHQGGTEQVQVSGTLRAGGEGVAAEARIAARGLSARVMAAYMPDGVEPSLRSGEVDLSTAFTLGRAAEGGYTATLAVDGLEYREGGGPSALARVASFTLDVGRIDPATGDLIVRRFAADGVEADARRRVDGTIELLGLALIPAPERSDASPTPSLLPSGPQTDVASMVQGSLAAPPLFALDELDIAIKRLAFADESRAGAAPVALADVNIRNTSPVRFLGPRPEDNPPAQIEVSGRLDPLIKDFRVAAEAAPFAARPAFAVAVSASGIDGTGVTRAAPELADLIDGSSLTDGRFRTSMTGEANFRRRGGGQVDFSRGVELNLVVQDTVFQSGESGPVLAGVERVHAEQVRFEPATGNVIARAVEVEGISGNAWRDESGVHVLGLVIKPLSGPAEAGPADSEPPAVALSAAESPDPAPAAPPPGASEPGAADPATGPEIRIERFSAAGLDFRFEDRLLDPPVVVPIDELELDIRGLSSQLLARDRPVRFNLSVGAGTVPLPARPRGGALTGAISDAVRSMADEIDTTPELEEREFFSQLIGSGTMSFYPAPRGRALLSINGLELSAVRGLAQAAGASIGGGVFEGRVDLRARDDGAVAVRTRLVLTDLRYAEPPDGPVARYMSLPVPIDAAIAAVEAPDGSITLPVNVTLDQRGLTTGKLVGAIAGAAGRVVGVAVASAPVKLVGGFAGLFVDTKGETTWVEEEPVLIEYPAGVSTLPPDAMRPLLDAISRARLSKRVQVSVEHRLGAADGALAARRASPVDSDAAALIQDLRLKRDALTARRAEMLGSVSAAALGLDVDPGAVDRLRRVHEDLAAVEESLDRLYELQRPGAAAQADRRARAAAIELIDARMGAVRQIVGRVGGSGASRIAVGGSKIDAASSERSQLVVRVRQQRQQKASTPARAAESNPPNTGHALPPGPGR